MKYSWIFFLLFSMPILAQKEEKSMMDEEGGLQRVFISFGPEINVLIPSNLGAQDYSFFKDQTLLVPNDSIAKVVPTPSFRIGGCIRFDFSKTFSLQTGIYYLTRNYTSQVGKANFNNNDIESLVFEDKYTFTAFEIPITGIFYVRLGKRFFMNNTIGIGIEFYPSSVQNFTGDSTSFNLYGGRNSWIMPTIKAAIGFEYRTENAGYFYLGGGFNRPFFGSLKSVIERPYAIPFGLQSTSINQSGTYFSIDFKYFLPPGRKNKWTNT